MTGPNRMTGPVPDEEIDLEPGEPAAPPEPGPEQEPAEQEEPGATEPDAPEPDSDDEET